jgi:prepilin-type N-terminal cleavage/methylation domain-containing protein
MKRMIQKRNGFSLIEVLVATIILVTAAMIAIPFFHNSLNIVKRFENKSKCEAIFQGALALIEAGGPERYRTPVNPVVRIRKGFWLPNSVNISNRNQEVFQVPDDPIVRNRFKVLLGSEHLYTPVDASTADPATLENRNGVVLYTPLLISGPMGYLGDLYLDGYCQNQKEVPELAQTIHDPNNPNVKIFLKVEKQNIDTGSLAGCGKFWPRARNQQSRTSNLPTLEPYSNGARTIANWPNWMDFDHGFLVTLRAEYPGVDPTKLETCEVKRSFRLPQDFQNVVDYTKDIKVLANSAFANTGALLPNSQGPLAQDTRLLSDKKDPGVYASLPKSIQPIFTNYYRTDDGKFDLHERRQCTQDSSVIGQKFTLRLDLENLEAEPGVVPMCLDTSKNWLETSTGDDWMWCSKNGSVTPGSSVQIVPDKQKLKKGWVPCESLRVCGETPLAVRTKFDPIPGFPGKQKLRYEWDYSFNNDTNQGAQPSKFWGCEIKYAVALVDPAGNLSYVKDTATTAARKAEMVTAGVNTPTVLPNAIKEIEPHIYFRPPPCYACNCKPCKGGLFGGFFNWILVLIVLVMFGLIGLALCLTGTLFGCMGGDYTVPDLSNAGYLNCQDASQCKCGHTCNKIKPPGPAWRDFIDPTEANAKEAKSCLPEVRTVSANGMSFNVRLANKQWTGSSYQYFMEPGQAVAHGDQVVWQQFDGAAGAICFAVHRCEDGVFKISQETYSDSTGKDVSGAMIGCGKVKTAHQILWDKNSDGKKPDVGPPICLEADYGKGITNPDGGPMMGYKDVNYECGNDLNPKEYAMPPVISKNPTERVVGVIVPDTCSQPFLLDGKTYAPAANLPIYSSYLNNDGSAAGGGFSQAFDCWTRCNLPFNTPQPGSGREMRYYENSIPSDLKLPLCQNSKSENVGAPPSQLDTPF